jgi:prepilin-type N-terminal cleavage/methylation domain-containing protein
MTEQRGFTLIELLVVIAIIGILSAIVLASLNTARSKGNDAGVKANLNTVSTQAAIYLSDNANSYGTFNNGAGAAAACPTSGSGSVVHDSTIMNAIAKALTDSSGGTAMCLSTDSDYAVAVSRPVDAAAPLPSTYWCVDSSGTRCGVNDNTLVGPSCGTCITSQ